MSDPTFTTTTGKTLTWEEAQEIYYAVQDVYDREDVGNEVDDRLEIGNITREQYDDIQQNIDEIVSKYRSHLDEDVGEVWNNTLGNVLYNFLNRKDKPYLWE